MTQAKEQEDGCVISGILFNIRKFFGFGKLIRKCFSVQSFTNKGTSKNIQYKPHFIAKLDQLSEKF